MTAAFFRLPHHLRLRVWSRARWARCRDLLPALLERRPATEVCYFHAGWDPGRSVPGSLRVTFVVSAEKSMLVAWSCAPARVEASTTAVYVWTGEKGIISPLYRADIVQYSSHLGMDELVSWEMVDGVVSFHSRTEYDSNCKPKRTRLTRYL